MTNKSFPILAILCIAASSTLAQQDRIAATVDPGQTTILKGSVSPLARERFDQGAVAPSFAIPYITLMLKRSPSQQAALLLLLTAQHDPFSPSYRHWLTPDEYAARFGVSTNDLSKIRAWLETSGFRIEYTARGRDWIAFSGAASQVRAALHTQVHRYVIDGERHFAICSDPSIPAALEPLVAGFAGLDDFVPKARRVQTSASSGASQNTLAPGDLATIYDINPLYQQGIDGTGQTVAVVGQSQLSLSDIQGFRAAYGLADQAIQTIQTGTDPGVEASAMAQAALDLEWVGAVARNASLIYVYSSDAIVAAIYAIDQNLAPVIGESYGQCEANVPASLVSAYQVEAQKANSLGITWLAAAGDQGAAACDSGTSIESLGLAVSFPASIPEVTAVGGAEFNEQTGSFWGATGSNGGTAISYIPEVAWNDTGGGGGIAAGGGGSSVLYPKPAWQQGAGVPADGARDVPDVAMAASISHDPYNVFTGGQWQLMGGTSAATPVLAGIVALLNQRLAANGSSSGAGNINTALYPMAGQSPRVFHDIVTGNNIVPCAAGTPDCAYGQFGYSAAAGYDPVTGLGTIDAYNLALAWPGSPAGQAAIASLSPAATTAGGDAFVLTVSGSNFVKGAVVSWASAPLNTTFVSATSLQAPVSAALIGAAGTVAVNVSNSGALSNTVYFTINASTPPGITIDPLSLRVTSQSPLPGCVPPPAQVDFATSSQTVYLYFAATVTPQDSLSSDWLAADGTTVAGTSWPSQAGNTCFTGANLPIATLSGKKLGSWKARIYDRGVQLVSVPFNVGASLPTAPVITAVENSASYASNAASPGEIVVIFGSGLGPDQLAGLTLDSNGLVNTEAGGTAVSFNGVLAPMIYSLATQVVAVVPYEVSGGTAQVTVAYQDQTSAAFPVPVASAVPGLFTYNSSGSGELAALNQDGSINSVFNPAAPGTVVVLFGTGEGQTSPGGVDGKLAVAPLPKPLQHVSVNIGGKPASVAYAGAAPGEVAGVLQVNATIPDGVFGNAVPVVVTVGSVQSQAGATIAVAPPAGKAVFTVLSPEMAASVNTANGAVNCIAPPAQNSFGVASAFAWVYFAYQYGRVGDTLQFNWVHPSGKVDSSQQSIALTTNGPGCAAQALTIQGAEAAAEPGVWQVRVSHNSALQFTLSFSITAAAPPFAVTARQTVDAPVTGAGGNPQYCAVPTAKNSFSSTDPYAWVWFTFHGGQSGDVFAFHWIHPSGQVDPSQPSTILNYSGSGCLAWSLPIANTPNAAETGNWQVQVYRNGTSLFALPFTVSGSVFGVTNNMTTLSPNVNGASQNCVTPFPMSPFLVSDTAVYSWLFFSGAQAGDVFTFNWVHPSRAVDPYQPSTTLTFSGAGCLVAALAISGAQPPIDLGAWWVNIYRNGTLVVTQQFTVGYSRSFAVTDQMTTSAVNLNTYGQLICLSPAPQNVIPVSGIVGGRYAYVYFTYKGAGAEDQIVVEWISDYEPSESQTSPRYVLSPGSSCYSDALSGGVDIVSGDLWHVTAFRNGTPLFTLHFTFE